MRRIEEQGKGQAPWGAFGAGLVLGGVAVGLAVWGLRASENGTAGSVRAGGFLDGSGGTRGGDVPAGDVYRFVGIGPPGEAAALDASPSERAPGGIAEAGREKVGVSVGSGEVAALLARLAALPTEGRFVSWAQAEPEALRGKIVDLLITVGDLAGAKGSLGEGAGGPLASQVAMAFENAGRAAEAADMWRELLTSASKEIGAAVAKGHGPHSWRYNSEGWPAWIEGLGRTDPAALVGLLEQWRTSAEGESVAGLDMLRAQHLFGLGRGEEAAGVLSTLVADPDMFDQALELLIEHAPERGEAVLRAELALGNDIQLRNRLMLMLVQQERTEEFQQMFAESAQSGEVGFTTILMQMADQLPQEQLEHFAQSPEHATFLGPMLAERYAEAGRLQDAAHAYDSMIQAAEQGHRLEYLSTPPEGLYEQDPGQILRWAQRLEVTNPTNDEVWGDIGDMWYRMGDTASARRAWERALALDPFDGEWVNNLRRIRGSGQR